MDQRRLILLGALLLAVIAAGIHWYDNTGNRVLSVQEKARQFAPESIVSGFAQTTFSPTGIRQYHLKAERVTHYSAQSAAEMLRPDILFYRDESLPDQAVPTDTIDWQASAATGIFHEEGDTLKLSGNVQVEKPLRDSETLNFETESLTIKPREEVASTDDPVTVRQALHVTRATGLHIDIAAGQVQLLSQVRSQYVPANTPPQ